MRALAVAFVCLWLGPWAHAQQPLGFSPSPAPGPALKLTGLTVVRVDGGYLAVSVPKKDLLRFLRAAGMLEPHMLAIEVLEHLGRDAEKLSVIARPSRDVPLGVIFLSTSEFFPKHKLLDRFVESVGRFTFLNRRGIPITVTAYAGGPGR